ncbi:MAG: ABC transporter ATP-binding protein [Leptospiraceae bacterium]|nr:ABC transporter ATP-binding protein [Leptospiraceae bacterium]
MIKIENLNIQYKSKSGSFFQKNIIKAVEDANLILEPHSITGLVGESGCGKSTLGRGILKLLPIQSGKILFHDEDISKYSSNEMMKYRKKMQIIFQDPYSSLNPRMNIWEIITEGLFFHEKITKEQAEERVISILEKMSLRPEILNRFPHEFSGGQRQRIAIARALILNPEFLVCDEISSALDVSSQAQLVNLILEFKKNNLLSILYISHDLGLISIVSDKIAVMYLGKIVEFGSKKDMMENPLHPYTKILFSNMFDLKNPKKKRMLLTGEIPGVLNKPKGCYFHTRCPIAKDICKELSPKYEEKSPSHFVACHFSGENL